MSPGPASAARRPRRAARPAPSAVGALSSLALLALPLLAACGDGSAAVPTTKAAHAAHAAAPGADPSRQLATNDPDAASAEVVDEGLPPAEGPAVGAPLYDFDEPWRDAEGRTRPLAALAGRPQVLALVYTHCTQSCPLIVEHLKRVADSLDARGVGAAKAGIVLVSLDPARDDPATWKAFAARHALDPARWTLLQATQGDEQVRALAAALALRYRRTADGEVDHANATTVLDARGVVRLQRIGLGGAGEVARVVGGLVR